MRVAIHQPNYVPWCGFFAKLGAADALVLLDDAQMPRGRSYVSRAQVLGEAGAQWLTVPTHHAADEPIHTVRCVDASFCRRHLLTLRSRYARCRCFTEVMALLAPIYTEFERRIAEEPRLVVLNQRLLAAIAAYLGLRQPMLLASELGAADPRHSRKIGEEIGAEIGGEIGAEINEERAKGARLIELVRAAGGTTYVSGAGGTRYQDPAAFAAAGLRLEVRRYEPVPYEQGRAFVPGLSILDALFRLGPGARELLRYPDGDTP